MKITFLGVGEACDALLPNTSLWVETGTEGRRCSVMLDCGFTVPPRYWLQTEDPDDLDALWISHFHGDHFFGAPALLLRFWEMRRTKPLVVIGQPGIEQLIWSSMDLAYPNFLPKLTYPLEFHTAIPGDTMHAAGLHWNFAESSHGQRNLSVRVNDGSEAIFYSGDGLPSEDTLELAKAAPWWFTKRSGWTSPRRATGRCRSASGSPGGPVSGGWHSSIFKGMKEKRNGRPF